MRISLPIFLAASCALAHGQVSPEKLAGMKADLAGQIDAMKKQAQVMTDTVFSFGELGFQEVETSKYLSGILEKEGFTIERGVAGIPIAEDMYANIKTVGLPVWSDDDQKLARALQHDLQQPEKGMPMKVPELKLPDPTVELTPAETNVGPPGGGSDDIGDVSWVVPTVTLRYPSDIPGGPGHNWANGVAMATPIAHKGVIAGAKVQAMTMLDILTKPELVVKAWDYFRNVQTKDAQYRSFLRTGDQPALWLNQKTMEEYRPRMKAFYYDSSKFDTYLDQLGIKYPALK